MPVRVAFVAAWLLLCGVVAATAYQTDQLVAENRTAIADTQQQTCGVWLGVYQLFYAWSEVTLPRKQAVEFRQQFLTDFEARCPNYQFAGVP